MGEKINEGEKLVGMSDAEKIIIGGKTWFYQYFFEDNSNADATVKLYDAEGRPVKEFDRLKSMTDWILEAVNEEQKRGREKMQETFMRRMEELKGDMTDSDFGIALGMSCSSVYQYLVGRRFPSVGALAQIADKFGVSVDWLIGRDGTD